MTFAEAHKWIPMLSPEGDQVWRTQTQVYLVAYRGRWSWVWMTPLNRDAAT